nr:hypothetical protein [Parabacteroides goldsteinii]
MQQANKWSFYLINKLLIVRCVLLLLFGWCLIGVFPIINFESDSINLITGCELMWKNGIQIPPSFSYEWNMQPLIYLLIIFVKHIIPFFTCEQIYCTLTFFCTVGYLYLISLFISKLIKTRWEYIMLILFLFPESYAISSYPNTAIFAATSSLLGFYLITHYKSWNIYSAILLVLAPLFRVDILIIYPVVFPLLLIKESWSKALVYSVFYAVSTIICISFIFWILSSNPLSTFDSFQDYVENRIFSDKFIIINITFFTFFNLLFILAGVILLAKDKQMKYLLISFIPILTTYYVLKDFGNATKHLLYILPFVAFIASYSICYLKYLTKVQKRYIVSPLIIFFILYSFISISITPASKPWINKTYAIQHAHPLIKATSIQISDQIECSLGIGIGQIIPTADELIPLTGSFFSPFYWSYIKTNERNERKQITEIINNGNINNIAVITYNAISFLTHYLVMDGYKLSILPQEKDWNSEIRYFEKEGRVITVHYNERDKDVNNITWAFQDIQKDKFYYFTGTDWEMYYINEGCTPAHSLTNRLSIINDLTIQDNDYE